MTNARAANHSRPAQPGEPRTFTKSAALWAQAQKLIPGGTNTISKRVDVFGGPEAYPAYIERGEGARVYDIDGACYIDFIAALAPIVLGYNHPKVNAAVADQLARGGLFSLPPSSEVALAQALVDTIPCAEQVRFFKTGAEAVSAAVRVARALTKRDVVVSCGYHGWHDWWAATRHEPGVPAAVAALTLSLPFGDLDAARTLIKARGRDIAAVVVTPALYGQNPPAGYLEELRRLTAENDIVLVFDEIITGFRWALGGAEEKYGVLPDLATFAKSMANGVPIAALAGRRGHMAPLEQNWISSTYASEATGIVAALATLQVLREERSIERLYRHAQVLTTGIERLADKVGVPVRTGDVLPAILVEFGKPGDPALSRAVMRHAAEHGVLLRPDGAGLSLCMIAALSDDDIAIALETIEQGLRVAVAA